MAEDLGCRVNLKTFERFVTSFPYFYCFHLSRRFAMPFHASVSISGRHKDNFAHHKASLNLIVRRFHAKECGECLPAYSVKFFVLIHQLRHYPVSILHS